VCRTEDAVRGEIVARLGADPFVSLGEPATRVVRIALEGDGTAPPMAVIDVEALDGTAADGGHRRLQTAAACDELLKAAALAASIALDPAVALAPPAAPAEPSLEAPPAPVPPRSSEPEPVLAPVERVVLELTPPDPLAVALPPGWVLIVGVGSQLTSAGSGTGSDVARGAHLTAGLRSGAFGWHTDLRLEGTRLLPTNGLNLVATAAPCAHASVDGPVGFFEGDIGGRLCATATGGLVGAGGSSTLYVGLGGRAGLDLLTRDRSTFGAWLQVERSVLPLAGEGSGDEAVPAFTLVTLGVSLGLAWPPG
jgi:hypothetical protein